MRTTLSDRRRRRPLRCVLALVALVLACTALPLATSGCGSKEAEAGPKPGDLNRERAAAIRKRFDAIEKKLGTLPQGRPDQKAVHETIRMEYSFCKINFEAKFQGRLGLLTEDVYQKTIERLESIERQLKKYPR